MKISLFATCLIDQLFPKVGISVVQVLEGLGHQVEFPTEQTCCGQPAFNTGYWDDTRAVARHFLRVFKDSEAIVCPSGSCATMVRRFYPEIFHGMPEATLARDVAARTFEFAEFLVRKLGVTDVGARFDGKITWHDSCHGLRELGLKKEPRQLLAAVRGLELVEMKECETCCGFGGTFSVKHHHISVAMAENKVESIEQTGVQYVAGCDTSCLMQINGLLEKRRSKIKTIHLAEILASR